MTRAGWLSPSLPGITSIFRSVVFTVPTTKMTRHYFSNLYIRPLILLFRLFFLEIITPLLAHAWTGLGATQIRPGPIIGLPPSAPLMETYSLSDGWRAQHPTSQEFTWRQPNRHQESRIDMIWMPTRYLGLVSSVGIYPFFRSDHSYVDLHIKVPFGVKCG